MRRKNETIKHTFRKQYKNHSISTFNIDVAFLFHTIVWRKHRYDCCNRNTKYIWQHMHFHDF